MFNFEQLRVRMSARSERVSDRESLRRVGGWEERASERLSRGLNGLETRQNGDSFSNKSVEVLEGRLKEIWRKFTNSIFSHVLRDFMSR